MKVLAITLDGLGDRPAPQLNGRTPLEAAHTPNLDAVASAGINGLLSAVGPGIAAGTPTAHAALFGCSLDEIPGRAVFHAVARGVVPPPEDVICLTRFSSVEAHGRGLRIVQRMMPGSEEDFEPLAAAIARKTFCGIDVELVYTGDSEGVLCLRGEVSDDITDCDPLGNDLPVIKAQPMEQAAEPEVAARTASAVNEYLRWAHAVLADHPVNARRRRDSQLPINFLLPKWAGRRLPLPTFRERFGFNPVSLTSEEVLRGVMYHLGVETREEELDDTEKDIVHRLGRAKGLLREGYDFVHIHTKQPDLVAHYADPLRKLREIEALDRGLLGLVEEMLPDEELVTVVTSDHATPSVSSGSFTPGHFHDQHAGEAVPLAIAGRNALRDGVNSFSERAGASGGLGLVLGKDFMNIILSQAERTNVIGWRPLAREVLYRPTTIDAFEL